jgi:4-amino-4-deoxy-L-arabinose transferase-like glycosyltransferase
MPATGPLPALRLIAAYPRRAFAAFALLHVALWTALPAALYPNLPLDLIEALTYGPEWQLGYDKLPPLPWWLAEIVYRTIGHDFGYYLLAQLVVISAFALVWATARQLVGATGALVSVLIADGLHYFNFTSPKFNHDVVQLPFWALAGFSFHAAIRKGRIADWILLGLALGMAFWAKYFAIVLAVPFALFILIDRDARACLRTPGPYVAIAAGLLVVAPHIVWLFANDFLPLAYAETRATAGYTVLGHITRPLIFAVGQLFWLLPSLLIALPLTLPRAEQKSEPSDELDYRIVTLIVFGPCAMLLAGSLVTGRSLITMWGYPFWLFIGLWLVMATRTVIDFPRLSRIAGTWGVVTMIYALVFVVQYAVLPHVDHRYRASLFPGDALAKNISMRFRAATGQPLHYVIADMWVGGNIHHYSSDHPRTLIDGKPARAPWINLDDLRKQGAAVVWTDGPLTKLPAGFSGIAAGAEMQPPFDLPMRWGGHGGVKVGWAILKPK